MEELQVPDLAIWVVRKSRFFHQLKLKIQDHGVLSLVYTSPMSRRTPKSKFVWGNDAQNMANIRNFGDHRYGQSPAVPSGCTTLQMACFTNQTSFVNTKCKIPSGPWWHIGHSLEVPTCLFAIIHLRGRIPCRALQIIFFYLARNLKLPHSLQNRVQHRRAWEGKLPSRGSKVMPPL
jgi:hypothetical protein